MSAVGCMCGWGRIVKGDVVTRCTNCGAKPYILSKVDKSDNDESESLPLEPEQEEKL